MYPLLGQADLIVGVRAGPRRYLFFSSNDRKNAPASVRPLPAILSTLMRLCSTAALGLLAMVPACQTSEFSPPNRHARVQAFISSCRIPEKHVACHPSSMKYHCGIQQCSDALLSHQERVIGRKSSGHAWIRMEAGQTRQASGCAEAEITLDAVSSSRRRYGMHLASMMVAGITLGVALHVSFISDMPEPATY